MEEKKKKLKIGIDIDEIVTEFVLGFLKFFNKKYNKNFNFEDMFSYDFWETLDIDKEESFRLAGDFFHSSFNTIELVEGAIKSINKLSENNEIFFITSRPINTKDKTENFLKSKFPYLKFKVFYSGDRFGRGKSKREICNDMGINFLIEDQEKYVLDCAESNVKCLLFDKPWNKNCPEHENIIRVNDWNEIMETIKMLTKKSKIENLSCFPQGEF